jgi:hypothetical protein
MSSAGGEAVSEVETERNMIYVAFGGGINSTAMLVGMLQRGFWQRAIWPKWVVFADTGGEKPETYRHVDLVEQWLKDTGDLELHRVKKDSMYESLEDECLRNNTLPALAFGWRSCSDKWKQAPQQKFMNHDEQAKEIWASGGKIIKAIGFGVDELHRAKPYEDEKYRNWYPLIDWKWNRNDCIEAIKRAGLPVPPKSSCFYCPAMRKSEIVQLSKDNPALYARALAMEENATAAHTIKGLGRSFSWKELVGPEVIEQVCMCFDGECSSI